MELEDESDWDDFVLRHPYGSPFHLIAWRKTIEEIFGYRALYLMAFDGTNICGVLPIFLIENVLVGRALLSIPFAVYGGVLANSHEVRKAFSDQVRTLGVALDVDYVELRNAYPEQCLGFDCLTRYVTFKQKIGTDEEAILQSIPRKTRAAVRKALKCEFNTQFRRETEAFEDLYHRNLRRLGTPSFPKKYFRTLLNHFGAMADIREARLGDQVASAVLSFYFRDQILPYYGASDPAMNEFAPNNFMYYDLMCSAGQAGYSVFDFGRSKKNVGGSYDFKAHWGMVEKELPYEMLLVKRKELPNFTPTNALFRAPRKLWQYLPLAVTRTIGPIFIRLVP
jgi:FemAB-related protein (PEP-CTERM system-associated)